VAAENDLLAALGAYLQGVAGLAPAAKTVGVAEPADASELPAVVLSLESISRAGNGLGEGSARIAGVLRADVCAAAAADAATLSAALVEALLAPAARTAILRLQAIGATELTSIGTPEPPLGLRRRTARFAFAFESESIPPEPQGEVIHTITIDTNLTVATADRATSAITTTDTSDKGTAVGAPLV
jgi:hypothetical protein